MKKTLLIATVLTTLAVGISQAQMPPGPGFGPPEGMNPGTRLVEELGLDEYQAAEIAAIFEEARALREEERDRSFENQEAIRTETHAAIMALLSEDQQIRFEELVQLRTERWMNGPGRGQGRRGGPRGPGDGTCDGTGTGDGTCDGSGASEATGNGNGNGNG